MRSLLLAVGILAVQALLTDEEVLRFVRSLNDCYDVNGDRSLNETELMGFVRGTLEGHTRCPAPKRDSILDSDDIGQLEDYFGNRTF